MYRYMHSVRLYNSSDDADVRPPSSPLRPAQLQTRVDHFMWYSRLPGASADWPSASNPAPVNQFDYATWHSELQSANAAAAVQPTAAPVIVLAQPDEAEPQAA